MSTEQRPHSAAPGTTPAPQGRDGERPDVRDAIARDVRRHARRATSETSFWRALSVVGAVGWSIALPSAGGAVLGWYLDRLFASGVRCTLLLLFAGVTCGAVLAWNAIRAAQREG